MSPSNIIVSVYKTGISDYNLFYIKQYLDNFAKILTWSTDLEDCDNILRIESRFAVAVEVTTTLRSFNIACTELQ
ncbi:MAG: hypothetical protein AB8F78_15600 [Saprospiraceae bacterium]